MLPALCLIPLVALLRVILGWQADVSSPWLAGCMPVSAIALCAGVYLPRRWSLAIPLGILLVSDGIIDRHFGTAFFTGAMFSRYFLLALIGGLGMNLRGNPRLARPANVLFGTVLCATLFYVGSIAFCWLGSPSYPQTLAGLGQALTVGLPGYLPSYYFYRNALVSDLLYSIVFIACIQRSVLPGKHASQQVRSESVAAVG